MKRSFLAFFLVLFLFQLNAQKEKSEGALKIIKLEVQFGIDSDKIKNYDPNIITNQLKDEAGFQIENLDLNNQELRSRNDVLPQIRFGLVLQVPKNEKLEWRNFINWTPKRKNQLIYTHNSLAEHVDNFGSSIGYEYSGLTIGLEQSEIGIESAIIYKIKERKTGKLYGGFGSNVGYTYKNNAYVTGSDLENITVITLKDRDQYIVLQGESPVYFYSNDDINLKPQFNHRLFVQIGGSAVIRDKFELGLDLRKGIGYSLMKDESTEFLRYFSTSLSARMMI